MTTPHHIVQSEREHHDRMAPQYDRFFADGLHYQLLHEEFVGLVAR